MKKLFKIIGIILIVIVLSLVTLPYFFKGKIETLVKEEGNKMLNAKFDFGNIDLSLISNFPLASITLEDFYLKGIDEFENDTLLAANEITAAVNIMSLFGDEGYDIKKILLDGVSLKAIVLSDGKVNWDVMKESDSDTVAVVEEDSVSAPIRIKLQKLTVSDFNLIYDDRKSNMYAQIEDFNATCSGDFGNLHTMLNLDVESEAVTFKMNGVPFLNRAEIAADMNIDADLENNKFTFTENTLQINAIKAAIDGWIAMTDAGMDMDVKLNSNQIGFKEVLSLIPAIYTKDFKGLKTDGNATLTAYAKGMLAGDSIVPEFNLSFDVKDAMFQYPSLPAGVNKINVTANIGNPGGALDKTVVNVKPLSFVMAGNPFSVTAILKNPISDMQFDAAAKGKLDLGKIKDIYPLEDMQLNGVVDADISVNGRMSYIEKEQYESIKAAGSVRLNNMTLQLKDIPEIDIKNSTLTFTPRYLQLSETTVNVGDNDITLDSKFENYLGYALKGTTLKGSLNVKSKSFDLNDFMTTDTTAVATTESDEGAVPDDSVAMGVIVVPENIDFTMQTTFDEVLFGKMSFKNIAGNLLVKDGKVDMKNLSLNTMGGNVVVNGYYNAPANVQPEFNAGLKLSNIVFAQAYKELNMVQKLAPIFNGLTGDFSGNINIDTKLDENMSPIISSLHGNGSLSTKDLSLKNVKAIQIVAEVLKKESLKEAKVKDLNIEFTIDEGRVNTKPFDIKLGDYKMNLSGSTGLDQTIDYKGKIAIPASAGKLSQLKTVDMTIGGTFTSPKVNIDLAALAKQAVSKVAENAIDKLLGGSSKSSENSDTTTTDKKADVTNKLINKALDFLKK